MGVRFALLGVLLSIASAAAPCPRASDMARGIEVQLVSSEGEQRRSVFRKTGPGRVDERRESQWITARSIVERRLQAGFFPLSQTVQGSPGSGSARLDETTAYPGHDVAALAIEPNTAFELRSVTTAADGTTQERLTRYEVGRLGAQPLAGCRPHMVRVTATEWQDGVKRHRSFLYFTRLGFGIEVEMIAPEGTLTHTITSLRKARR